MKKLVVLSIAVIMFCAIQATAVVAGTMYVLPDGSGDAPTIQAGLELCATGDTVLVAAGTYYENLVWPGVDGIVLMSESGPDVSTIDGSAAGRVITINTGVDATTTIDGFTIQNGYTVNQAGAGILCANGSAPTIINNHITQNNATGSTGVASGGGIFCNGSSPAILNNNITQNSGIHGGGIGCRYGSSPVIESNTITNNTASGEISSSGGGIGVASDSNPIIIRNTIASNLAHFAGGGIIIAFRCAGTIDNNTIANNSSEFGGGIVCEAASPTITGNLITANAGTAGGGGLKIKQIAYGFGYPYLYSNVITENTSNQGAGIFIDGASPTIAGCVIVNNYGDGVYFGVEESGSFEPVITPFNSIHSNLGYGVRNTYPDVVIDATMNWWGDTSGPFHPTENPDGLGDQVSDYLVFDPWFYLSDARESQPSAEASLGPTYPNPFNPQTTILFELDVPQQAEIAVFNLKGMLLSVLESRTYGAGQHSVIWDGCNSSGHAMPSGTYVVHLRIESGVQAKKIMLVR